MAGDREVIDALNEVLASELGAINQYFGHAKLCQSWGYLRLAKKKREESLEEMQHADELIERILHLEGIPNMQRINPVRIGEDAVEQHRLDLELEQAALERLNRAIQLCRAKGDNGSAALLEKILQAEEEAIDWLESQLHQIEEIGKERYLAEQIRE